MANVVDCVELEKSVVELLGVWRERCCCDGDGEAVGYTMDVVSDRLGAQHGTMIELIERLERYGNRLGSAEVNSLAKEMRQVCHNYGNMLTIAFGWRVLAAANGLEVEGGDGLDDV